MNTILNKLYTTVVAKKQKAVAAFLVAAVGSFVARHGFTLDASALNYLQAVVLGVFGHLAVYFSANK